jgi:hypothetical protein
MRVRGLEAEEDELHVRQVFHLVHLGLTDTQCPNHRSASLQLLDQRWREFPESIWILVRREEDGR